MTVYDLANRGLIRISLLAIGLAASFAAGAAVAGSLVEFPNLPGREPAHLIGYLSRPDAGLSALASSQRGDNAPYPAVVVLHGCSGISSHSAAIADRLGAWGYVALTVDTLGPRGITGRCGGRLSTRPSMPMRHCATCLGWNSSIRRRSPSSANRWVAKPRFTPLLATWRRNTLPSGSAPPSPIIRTAASPMGPI